MFRERMAVWTEAIRAHTPPSAVVADIGCGSGVITSIAARFAAKVVALDASPEMAALARKSLAEAGAHNVDVIESRIEGMAEVLPTGIDVIVCSSVIEYLADPDRFLADCRFLLRPGGILMLSGPNPRSAYRMIERAAFAAFGRPEYLHFVNRGLLDVGLDERLKRNGFDVLRVEHFGAVPMASSPLRRLGCARWIDTMTLHTAVRL
jgi:2-polyprenyl-3-methyl-5-hydroxy-6-metoxy-1,4-benzoquinol methylase